MVFRMKKESDQSPPVTPREVPNHDMVPLEVQEANSEEVESPVEATTHHVHFTSDPTEV